MKEKVLKGQVEDVLGEMERFKKQLVEMQEKVPKPLSSQRRGIISKDANKDAIDEILRNQFRGNHFTRKKKGTEGMFVPDEIKSLSNGMDCRNHRCGIPVPYIFQEEPRTDVRDIYVRHINDSDDIKSLEQSKLIKGSGSCSSTEGTDIKCSTRICRPSLKLTGDADSTACSQQSAIKSSCKAKRTVRKVRAATLPEIIIDTASAPSASSSRERGKKKISQIHEFRISTNRPESLPKHAQIQLHDVFPNDSNGFSLHPKQQSRTYPFVQDNQFMRTPAFVYLKPNNRILSHPMERHLDFIPDLQTDMQVFSESNHSDELSEQAPTPKGDRLTDIRLGVKLNKESRTFARILDKVLSENKSKLPGQCLE